MKLEETNARVSFDIASGEDNMVLTLVESFSSNSIDDFIYNNKKLLDKIEPFRVDQFFQIVGESKRFILQDAHKAFKKTNRDEKKTCHFE